jgi:hypothetical protein
VMIGGIRTSLRALNSTGPCNLSKRNAFMLLMQEKVMHVHCLFTRPS